MKSIPLLFATIAFSFSHGSFNSNLAFQKPTHLVFCIIQFVPCKFVMRWYRKRSLHSISWTHAMQVNHVCNRGRFLIFFHLPKRFWVTSLSIRRFKHLHLSPCDKYQSKMYCYHYSIESSQCNHFFLISLKDQLQEPGYCILNLHIALDSPSHKHRRILCVKVKTKIHFIRPHSKLIILLFNKVFWSCKDIVHADEILFWTQFEDEG